MGRINCLYVRCGVCESINYKTAELNSQTLTLLRAIALDFLGISTEFM